MSVTKIATADKAVVHTSRSKPAKTQAQVARATNPKSSSAATARDAGIAGSNTKAVRNKRPSANRAAARPHDNTKHDQILKLLRRSRGASLQELQAATGWQPHSVRGFLSGTVKKRLGLALKSEKSKQGERCYSTPTS